MTAFPAAGTAKSSTLFAQPRRKPVGVRMKIEVRTKAVEHVVGK